jgi:hypothetical protein
MRMRNGVVGTRIAYNVPECGCPTEESTHSYAELAARLLFAVWSHRRASGTVLVDKNLVPWSA